MPEGKKAAVKVNGVIYNFAIVKIFFNVKYDLYKEAKKFVLFFFV